MQSCSVPADVDGGYKFASNGASISASYHVFSASLSPVDLPESAIWQLEVGWDSVYAKLGAVGRDVFRTRLQGLAGLSTCSFVQLALL
mmetsp:Transcript_9662/g.15858  ORF Transcript_9662/g.15858 Transcript_9662/m.15858 type:complete len:88 (-) Transcript_9662:163-426(-)